MDKDALKRLQEALALYRELPGTPTSKSVEAVLKDFLENGPGTREQRLDAMAKVFQQLDQGYRASLKRRH